MVMFHQASDSRQSTQETETKITVAREVTQLLQFSSACVDGVLRRREDAERNEDHINSATRGSRLHFFHAIELAASCENT